MKVLKQKWIVTICIVFLIGVISFLGLKQTNTTKLVLAGTGDNITGFAWSANIGWISFNSTDCDLNSNGFIDSGACGGDDASTPVQNYGVAVDQVTGYFSGHAWSPHVGWIDFAPTGTTTPARFDTYSGQVSGWAKILSLGNDGWIKLRDNGSPSYGVSVSSSTHEFSGWAWNGNDSGSGIGWISFNSRDCDTDNNGTIDIASCGTIGSPIASYRVNAQIENMPTIASMTAPNWNWQQAANLQNARRAILRWTLGAGSTQSAYQVVVDNNADFSSPVYDSGKVINSVLRQVTLDQTVLSYNTAYYWKVMIWNNFDVNSGWIQYDSATDTDNDDGNNLTFTTYKHEMPIPMFTTFPARPSRGEAVRFIDGSKIYQIGSPSTPVSCTDPLCNWLWTASGGSINNSATTSPIISGLVSGNTVTLKITDTDGYEISTSTTMSFGSALPKWNEVK